ncbi:MAG TPA: hypothetical protein PLF50_01890 [Candidatus Cloacimonadota bacterium]|nr:hypothetical protein [Candidatus Cloacimonadota bacterium]
MHLSLQDILLLQPTVKNMELNFVASLIEQGIIKVSDLVWLPYTFRVEADRTRFIVSLKRSEKNAKSKRRQGTQL